MLTIEQLEIQVAQLQQEVGALRDAAEESARATSEQPTDEPIEQIQGIPAALDTPPSDSMWAPSGSEDDQTFTSFEIVFDEQDATAPNDIGFVKGNVYDGEDARTARSEGSAFGGWWPGNSVTLTAETYFWIDYALVATTWTMGQGNAAAMAAAAAATRHCVKPLCRIGWDSGIDATDIEVYHTGDVYFPRKLALEADLNSDYLGKDYNNGILRIAAAGTKPTGTGATTGMHWEHANADDDHVTLYHGDTSSVADVTASSDYVVTGMTFDTFGHMLTHSKAKASTLITIASAGSDSFTYVTDMQHDISTHLFQKKTQTMTLTKYTVTIDGTGYVFSVMTKGAESAWTTITGGILAPHSAEHP